MTTDCKTFRQLGLVNCIQYTVDEDLRGRNILQSFVIDRLILLCICSSRSIGQLSQHSNEPLYVIIENGMARAHFQGSGKCPPHLRSLSSALTRATYTRVIKNWLLHVCVCIRRHTWQDVYLGVHPMTMASPRYHQILMYFGQSSKMAAKTTD